MLSSIVYKVSYHYQSISYYIVLEYTLTKSEYNHG